MKVILRLFRNLHIPPNYKYYKQNKNYLKELKEHGNYIANMIPKHIEAVLLNEQTKEMELIIPHTSVLPVLRFLKSHVNTQYTQLMDITGMDIPKRENRFQIIYNLLSIYYNSRIRVKTCVDELTPIESVTKIFLSADWAEREIFDMFGVYFKNHSDMRRILTDYGFEGHPLRKDFPLSGYYELRYDPEEFYIAERPVQFPQEYRKFEISNPWETLSEKENK